MVHDLFGGKLLGADVFVGGEKVEGHMWNRLPSGFDVDLTREQFRDGQVIGEPRTRQRPGSFPSDHPRYHRYEAYLVLAERVHERLRAAGFGGG